MLINNPYDIGEVVQSGEFISQDYGINLEKYSTKVLRKELKLKKEVVFLCAIESTGRGGYCVSSFLTIKYSDDNKGIIVSGYESVPQRGWDNFPKQKISFRAEELDFVYEKIINTSAPEDFNYYGVDSLWASGYHGEGVFNLESLC